MPTKSRLAGGHLDPAKVMLSPDCGLTSISRDLARAKLKVMVAAAGDLRKGM
jgi:methionine synthase II (cobalamin-independent)